uniref:PAM2 domain-containing protein n=1 Tax=Globodera pallida TaxID=36090 RepID=A0A183CGR0_GLOPA
MDPKSGDSPTRESGEDGVEESADEEEEDESNGSSDAEPNHQPMNSAINFGYTAGPPVHAMVNPSMGSSAMAHPYQFQNMAQNFFGRAVTSQQQQFPPFDFVRLI